MISHKKKYIYIHNQKTAGNSITQFLKKNSEVILENHHLKHAGIKHYFHKYGKEICNEYFKFIFIRNPWDRMLSYYFFELSQYYIKKININNKKHYNQFSKEINLFFCHDQFCKFLNDYKQYNQLKLIKDNNNNNKINFIGRYENLFQDMNYILSQINIDKNLLKKDFPYENKGNHRSYIYYYNNKSKNIIYNNFREEIDFFRFDFFNNELKNGFKQIL